MNTPATELELDRPEFIPEIFGSHDANLKLIEKKFNVRITTRGNQLSIHGEPEASKQTARLLLQLQKLVEEGISLRNGDVKFAIRLAYDEPETNLLSIFSERIHISKERGFISAKGSAQKRLIRAVKSSDIVMAIGPAGTGKTYLAVALAVEGLLRRQFKKIMLVRPAVEAGEKLGYLPGDLIEKINPYLMPLYDALNDMLEAPKVRELLGEGVIEIAPLAYMRGRTLNDSFIILDEAQNSTRQQMKMFLTRLGFRSKMVVTGDVTQVDLPRQEDSGLLHVRRLLNEVEGIEFVDFTEKDVVRHELVRKIIKAYESNPSAE
ncbi:MAG: PhoH family protein [Candidatus Nitrohelix vancouverensis]|uniref:PhoH-like protein n=1 Tax=Candidatus Nitrohelix vancouverensis TaxID=2705534 RepID=A0A7T0C2V8_9BACT|nr:MAG: PhoH family protein [Candidatus Nitrohelix vancouverensis]